MVLRWVNAQVVVPRKVTHERLEIDTALSELNAILESAASSGATDKELHEKALTYLNSIRDLYKTRK